VYLSLADGVQIESPIADRHRRRRTVHADARPGRRHLVGSDSCGFTSRAFRPKYGPRELSRSEVESGTSGCPASRLASGLECTTSSMRSANRGFYLDLIREGQVHACRASDLVRGIEGARSRRRSCQLPDPKGIRPHGVPEWRPLHEFGHCLHAMFMGPRRWIEHGRRDRVTSSRPVPDARRMDRIRDRALRRSTRREPVPRSRRETENVRTRLEGLRRRATRPRTCPSSTTRHRRGDTDEDAEAVSGAFPLVPFHPGTHFQSTSVT